MPEKITVLLVEDHSLVRRGFRLMLEDDPEIEVIAEASDGEEAVRVANELRPQVIVMDCAMPNLNGMDATRQIREQLPQTAVLMLSMYSENAWVRRALEAGANGYVLKSAADLDLADCIKRVAAGETVLDPSVAPFSVLKGEKALGLSRRELEVLRLIVSGRSNKEIASDLGLSANTIAVHRANIMDSLGIHNTAELVVYAIKNGLVILS